MNDKEKDTKTPEAAKKKGFYVALYSCVGVMLALAAVIGYYNLKAGRYEAQNESPRTEITTDQSGDAYEVDSRYDSGFPGYLTPDDSDYLGGNKPTQSPQASSSPPPSSAPSASKAPSASSTPSASKAPSASSTPSTSNAPSAAKTPATDSTASPTPSESPNSASIIIEPDIDVLVNDSPVSQMDIPEEQPEESSGEQADAETDTQEQENESAAVSTPDKPKTFTEFTEEDKMVWPVSGDVVMDYSTDHVIYDKTLDQFRTNDTLCIASEFASPVRAAAAGRVKDVYTTSVTGKTVVIDHGNGWITTYSQLNDDVLVMVGDVVESGEEFASVGTPSRFSALLGDHLGFVVFKDDVTVNPLDLLH